MDQPNIQLVADLLSEFDPGFLPYEVFEQIARIIVLPIIEFIPLRLKDDQVEVLLLPRGSDDPYWPNMLHTPGTVIRATDLNDSEDNWPAFQRIIEDELKNTKIVTPPHYVGSMLHTSKRGAEQAQLFWVEVIAEPEIGKFYSAENLPATLIESQKDFIEEAVRNFKDYKLKS